MPSLPAGAGLVGQEAGIYELMFRALILAILLISPAVAKPTATELCIQADALVKRHEMKQALAKYDEAIRTDKHCARPYAALGKLYYQVSQMGKPDPKLTKMAILFLSKAIQLNPKDDQSLFYRGDLYVNAKKYPLALKDLNRSLSLKPRSLAHLSRAVCYSGMKRHQKAVDDYTVSYEMTHDASCLYGRANNYMELKLPDQALSDYERVAKECTDPKTVAAAQGEINQIHRMVGVGETVKSSGDAVQAFEQARQLKNTGHPKESLALFDKALALDPKFAKAAIYKGDAYFMMDDLDRNMSSICGQSSIDVSIR
jgi:tetratricopeptide (TPR) repeat protein